jgi:hypothetical protein
MKVSFLKLESFHRRKHGEGRENFQGLSLGKYMVMARLDPFGEEDGTIDTAYLTTTG